MFLDKRNVKVPSFPNLVHHLYSRKISLKKYIRGSKIDLVVLENLQKNSNHISHFVDVRHFFFTRFWKHFILGKIFLSFFLPLIISSSPHILHAPSAECDAVNVPRLSEEGIPKLYLPCTTVACVLSPAVISKFMWTLWWEGCESCLKRRGKVRRTFFYCRDSKIILMKWLLLYNFRRKCQNSFSILDIIGLSVSITSI